MFTDNANKQTHFDSACARFASAHVLSEVARDADIGEQMLRNKLNPSQPHQMTVRDLIAVYHATAHVAGATAQAANVLSDARITKTARNAVVGGLMAGIEHMVLLMAEVENKFQAVPGIACAADIARTALGA